MRGIVKLEEMPESEDINPNIERNFNRIHPFLFIYTKNEKGVVVPLGRLILG